MHKGIKQYLRILTHAVAIAYEGSLPSPHLIQVHSSIFFNDIDKWPNMWKCRILRYHSNLTGLHKFDVMRSNIQQVHESLELTWFHITHLRFREERFSHVIVRLVVLLVVVVVEYNVDIGSEWSSEEGSSSWLSRLNYRLNRSWKTSHGCLKSLNGSNSGVQCVRGCLISHSASVSAEEACEELV